MNGLGRNLIFWLAVAHVLIFLLNVLQGQQNAGVSGGEEMSYSEFMAGAQDGRVRDVVIKGNEVQGTLSSSGESFSVVVPPNENVVDLLTGTVF